MLIKLTVIKGLVSLIHYNKYHVVNNILFHFVALISERLSHLSEESQHKSVV